METLRLWLGPIVTSVTVILGGVGSYYTVQARIFEEIAHVGKESGELLAQAKEDAAATQAALRETVVSLDMAVRGLTAAVGELKSDIRETKGRLDSVRESVVRLEAKDGASEQRR